MVAGRGIAVPAGAMTLDLPVMLGVALVCVPIFYTGRTISRWEGALVLGYYVAYTAHLALDAGGHAALGPYRAVVGLVALPLTAAVLVATTGVRVKRRITFARAVARRVVSGQAPALEVTAS